MSAAGHSSSLKSSGDLFWAGQAFRKVEPCHTDAAIRHAVVYVEWVRGAEVVTSVYARWENHVHPPSTPRERMGLKRARVTGSG
jgi:hypothetical protein